jgi:hypothetical protein
MCRPVIMALEVQRGPLDQTDLRNGVDVILGGGGGIFWKLLMSGRHKGLGDMVVGLASPTWHPLEVCYSVVSSGVLWNLLELLSLRLSLILFDVLILLAGFLIKSC